MLSVYEQLFLLALDEEKGNFLQFTKKTIPYGLAGAILADLAIHGSICTNEKQRLELSDGAPAIDDALLDEVLQEIRSAEKPRKFPYWITLLKERPKKLRVRLGEQMATKNLVAQDETHFSWPAPAHEATTEAWPRSKFELKYPLRSAVLTDIEPAPGSLALLNIIAACDLLNLIFTEDERPQAQRLIHEKVIQAALKTPSLQTIEAIGYAIGTAIEDESE